MFQQPDSKLPCTLAATLLLSFTCGASFGQVVPYGGAFNPPGSLTVLGGVPQVGASLTVGLSNTATPSAPPSLALLFVSTALAPGYPNAPALPGLGLLGPGAPGELLVSLVPGELLATFGPAAWLGGLSAPASIQLDLPLVPAWIGRTLYLQGALITATPLISIGLTNGLSTTLSAPLYPGLALIPAGTFDMGSDAPGGAPYFNGAPSKPVHAVTISRPFWMGRTEVTQAQYQALMGTNPSLYLGADRPVERVSWFDAQAYCAALNAQQSALGQLPDGYHYRLPTEAEWEYACRAGVEREFHFGPDLFCDQARFWFSYHAQGSCLLSSNPALPNGGTATVASYPPNAFGLHDMHGNVWEWCQDGFAQYTATPKVDPFNPGGPFRQQRGGAWNSPSFLCRSASRSSGNPGVESTNLGFRVVLAPILP
jgi:formylglycine-generating enzyme required for sulfatase activity